MEEQQKRNSRKIQIQTDALEKLKRQMPYGLVTIVLVSFILPLVPRWRNQLTDIVNYPTAVLFFLILGGTTYWLGYRQILKQRKATIEKISEKQQETSG